MLKHDSGISVLASRFFGAVRSGSKAARLAMLIKALSPFTRLVDKAIYLSLNRSDHNEAKLPKCLMIVSPPRSGSTIIYQVLTRVIPCVYISNLHTLFPNHASPYLLRRDLFGSKLVGFHNYYGHTSSFYDVNEGNEFVEAIFRGNPDKEQIRGRFFTFIKMMRATEERPLIFKNVQAYSHVGCLHQAVPEVIFLRIKRDLEQVIQSVVHAYHELGTFNPVPKNLINSEINDPVEFAVHQVREIERTIDHQINQIEKSARLEWWYEDFCSDPWPMIVNLGENYLRVDVSRLRGSAMPEMKASNRVKVTGEEATHISTLLQKLKEVVE